MGAAACLGFLLPAGSLRTHSSRAICVGSGSVCDVLTTPGTHVGSDNRICTNTGTLDAHEMLAEYARLLFGFTTPFRRLNTLWSGPSSDFCHILIHLEWIQCRGDQDLSFVLPPSPPGSSKWISTLQPDGNSAFPLWACSSPSHVTTTPS